MDIPEREDERYPGEQDALEGAFDAQLSFPTPFVEAPQPIQIIRKRDGREVPFDKSRIAETIFQAAESIGGSDRDRAESLASGVALYLMKHLNGQPPTVDQVSDAVEKVLIEMGHAKTALAYARVRDRRARIRRLREGDTQNILNELEEARRGTVSRAALQGEGMVVRTSAETLDGWKRERIVEALVRETGLEEATASIIAFEVEQQILSAGIATLTAPLVREMVDAKLAEHGLETYRKRHMRLGLPLYDAERIVAGTDYTGPAGLDPERTDLLLAERVKKEYALSQVFSQEVADAHLAGELHLHDLGRIDRLFGAVHSPAVVQLFGSDVRMGRKPLRLPRAVDGLIHELASLNRVFRTHFTNFLAWDAVNEFFAPYVAGADKRMLSQVAYALAVECGDSPSEAGPESVLHLSWDVPSTLQHEEAIGPGGTHTGKTYLEYRHTAKSLAWAIVEACGNCGTRHQLPMPQLVIDLSSAFFRSHGYDSFLRHVADLVSHRGRVRFRLVRGEGPVSNGHALWSPRLTVVHKVSLNLPRATASARDETVLFDETARLVAVAVAAHTQKVAFIRRLAALRDAGPLAALTLDHDGRPYLDLLDPVCYLGVVGLNECVQRMCGTPLHESEAAQALASRLLEHLKGLCAAARESAGIEVVLVETDDEDVCRRFAALDQVQPATDQEPAYTPGVRLPAGSQLSPMERLRIEGRFHPFLGDGTMTSVSVPDIDTSRVSIANFIKKAFRQTSATGLSISL